MAKRHIIDCDDAEDVKSVMVKNKDSKHVNVTFSLTRDESDVVDSRKLCFAIDKKRMKDGAEFLNLSESDGFALLLNNNLSVKIKESESGQIFFAVDCEAMTEEFNISREILNEVSDYISKL